MTSPAERTPKLVKAFAQGRHRLSADAQSGYEKVDDHRVLERCFYPLRWRERDQSPMEMLVTVTLFDFKSFIATVTRETVNRDGALVGAPQHTDIAFESFGNRAAIAEARRALVALGGSPCPIDALLDDDVSVKKPVTPLKPLRLNKNLNKKAP
jgi:hypothetical protein